MAESESILAALENCESEPIRTPEAVQPHGCVCVCDLQFEHVTHISQNAALYFNRPPEAILGQRVNDVFERSFCHAIRNAASLRTVTTQREYLGEFDFGCGSVEVACHQRGPHIIVELGQKNAEHARRGLDINRLRWLMSKWEPHEHALSDALEILVHDLRMLTGYSRVMAYRFRPDGSGEVIAESLAPKAESYLGLRFPKWDIPEIARAIALEQPLRLIADISADDLPLLAWRKNSEPVDMTLTELRATSPIHKKYLTNMGVGASLVLPVVHQGKLWGMFSFHHNKSRKFTIQESLSIELVGQMLSAHLGKILQYNLDTGINRCKSIAENLSHLDPNKVGHLSREWRDAAADICAILDLDGVVLESDNGRLDFGAVPDGDLTHLREELTPTSSVGICITDNLEKDQLPGLLIMEIDGQYAKRLWLFRKEENSKVDWAGAPHKEIDTSDGQVSLAPRSSFSTYTDISKGKSRPWEPEDLTMAIALQTTINQVTIINNVDNDGGFRNEEYSDLLSQQVKITMLMFRSMLKNGMVEGSANVDKIGAFTNYLEREVSSTAKHDLFNIISQISNLQGLQGVNASGPEISIRKSAILTFIILVRECLEAFQDTQTSSNDEVIRVGIEWKVVQQGLSIHFSGVSEVNKTVGAVLGSELKPLEKAVQNLGGKVDIDRKSAQIFMTIPSHHIVGEQAATSVTDQGEIEDAKVAVRSPKVLVLDDNDAFEVELRIMLRKLNVWDVTFAKSHEAAAEMIESQRIDIALLNTRLLSPQNLFLLEQMTEMDVPFAFLTSFKDEAPWLQDYEQHPIIVKPVREDRLKAIIKPALHGEPAGDILRILLIEDSAPLQEQLRSELTGLGHIVECASSVHEAEAILNELHVDLIVIDLFIDIGDGHIQEGTLRIVSRIRNEIKNSYNVHKDVPILAISGSVEIPGGYSPLKMASQIGANECMQKPLNMKHFVSWILEMANNKHLNLDGS